MIVLYGLIDRQALRFRREFPTVLLWPRKRLFSASLGGVQAIVLCVKFLGHVEQQRVISFYGRSRVHLVYGGDSAIRQKLTELVRRLEYPLGVKV